MLVAEHAAKNNKCFLMNLSAPFICEFYSRPQDEALKQVLSFLLNFIFTYLTENMEQIALKLAELPKRIRQEDSWDTFVGGFLSQLVGEKSIEECIRAGCYAANVIIQRSGCTYPDKPDFN
ncbi:hypothetical protein LUZ60_016489 [Juncus effusus]|nr:hypothetical protein LUZ60_016489 [Juncus effusus]